MLSLLLLAGCGAPPAPPEVPPLDRLEFNQRAVELALPVFQRADGTVVRYDAALPFDGDVDAAAARVRGWDGAIAPGPDAARREAVRAELAAGRITLVETDLRDSPDKEMVRHLVAAAGGIETLFALQTGASEYAGLVPADDPASLALFARNQGPWCQTPAAAPACSAVPVPAPRISGLYPPALQVAGFCATLSTEHPDVMAPFVIAVADGDTLRAEPYPKAWPARMDAVAGELRAAADAAPADEAAMATYLRAAADAFQTNDWVAADEAWAAMGKAPSRWYVRVAPDETYFDPCGEHAGFALTLAHRDASGEATRALLEPVKQDMEQALAGLAGPPYVARQVGFDLPEFIEIVLNAGDSRNPTGATVGQSLPNWGPVADAGGRTVAMTNIGTDPDSVAARREALTALFCEDTIGAWPSEPGPLRFSTVLHEAGHNLGPSHEYRVDGKTDEEVFGGSRASMLEELKAQTAALYLTDWLAADGVIPAKDTWPIHVADMAWALAKIAKGMYAPDGSDLHYDQLAAIQVGYLVDHGGLVWRAEQHAANDVDTGCLEADPDKLPGAIAAMMTDVLRIKATGDVAAAQGLVDRYVDGDGLPPALRAAAVERFGRVPEASFAYRIVLE